MDLDPPSFADASSHGFESAVEEGHRSEPTSNNGRLDSPPTHSSSSELSLEESRELCKSRCENSVGDGHPSPFTISTPFTSVSLPSSNLSYSVAKLASIVPPTGMGRGKGRGKPSVAVYAALAAQHPVPPSASSPFPPNSVNPSIGVNHSARINPFLQTATYLSSVRENSTAFENYRRQGSVQDARSNTIGPPPHTVNSNNSLSKSSSRTKHSISRTSLVKHSSKSSLNAKKTIKNAEKRASQEKSSLSNSSHAVHRRTARTDREKPPPPRVRREHCLRFFPHIFPSSNTEEVSSDTFSAVATDENVLDDAKSFADLLLPDLIQGFVEEYLVSEILLSSRDLMLENYTLRPMSSESTPVIVSPGHHRTNSSKQKSFVSVNIDSDTSTEEERFSFPCLKRSTWNGLESIMFSSVRKQLEDLRWRWEWLRKQHSSVERELDVVDAILDDLSDPEEFIDVEFPQTNPSSSLPVLKNENLHSDQVSHIVSPSQLDSSSHSPNLSDRRLEERIDWVESSQNMTDRTPVSRRIRPYSHFDATPLFYDDGSRTPVGCSERIGESPLTQFLKRRRNLQSSFELEPHFESPPSVERESKVFDFTKLRFSSSSQFDGGEDSKDISNSGSANGNWRRRRRFRLYDLRGATWINSAYHYSDIESLPSASDADFDGETEKETEESSPHSSDSSHHLRRSRRAVTSTRLRYSSLISDTRARRASILPPVTQREHHTESASKTVNVSPLSVSAQDQTSVDNEMADVNEISSSRLWPYDGSYVSRHDYALVDSTRQKIFFQPSCTLLRPPYLTSRSIPPAFLELERIPVDEQHEKDGISTRFMEEKLQLERDREKYEKRFLQKRSLSKISSDSDFDSASHISTSCDRTSHSLLGSHPAVVVSSQSLSIEEAIQKANDPIRPLHCKEAFLEKEKHLQRIPYVLSRRWLGLRPVYRDQVRFCESSEASLPTDEAVSSRCRALGIHLGPCSSYLEEVVSRHPLRPLFDSKSDIGWAYIPPEQLFDDSRAKAESSNTSDRGNLADTEDNGLFESSDDSLFSDGEGDHSLFARSTPKQTSSKVSKRKSSSSSVSRSPMYPPPPRTSSSSTDLSLSTQRTAPMSNSSSLKKKKGGKVKKKKSKVVRPSRTRSVDGPVDSLQLALLREFEVSIGDVVGLPASVPIFEKPAEIPTPEFRTRPVSSSRSQSESADTEATVLEEDNDSSCNHIEPRRLDFDSRIPSHIDGVYLRENVSNEIDEEDIDQSMYTKCHKLREVEERQRWLIPRLEQLRLRHKILREELEGLRHGEIGLDFIVDKYKDSIPKVQLRSLFPEYALKKEAQARQMAQASNTNVASNVEGIETAHISSIEELSVNNSGDQSSLTETLMGSPPIDGERQSENEIQSITVADVSDELFMDVDDNILNMTSS